MEPPISLYLTRTNGIDSGRVLKFGLILGIVPLFLSLALYVVFVVIVITLFTGRRVTEK